jgi:PadR family transcriptional regulator, regulatory protein PadR
MKSNGILTTENSSAIQFTGQASNAGVNRLGVEVNVGKPSDLLQGTLDLLILKTIALEPRHGWAIAKRIEQSSNNVLQITQGALYPALHRLEQQAWVKGEWRATETGREAKFYSLTRAGRARLEKELEQWDRLSGAVALVIRTV